MALSNLPPGVTDRMIDEQFGGPDDREYCPNCGELAEDCECDPPEDDEEEDEELSEEYYRQLDEESMSHRHDINENINYREAMEDSGRGHLLR